MIAIADIDGALKSIYEMAESNKLDRGKINAEIKKETSI